MAPTVPAIAGGVDLKIPMLLNTYVIIVPALPMAKAGKTNDQYRSGRSAWVRRTVPVIMPAYPTRRIYLTEIYFARGDVNDIAAPAIPMGSIRTAAMMIDHW
jgi:hypothetical protein